MLIDPASSASPSMLMAHETYSVRFRPFASHIQPTMSAPKDAPAQKIPLMAPGDRIVVRAVLAEVKILYEARLAEGIGNDAKPVTEC